MPFALRGIPKFQQGEDLLVEYILLPRYSSCHFEKREKVGIFIKMHTCIFILSSPKFHIPLFLILKNNHF